jgi:hypothetical protein
MGGYTPRRSWVALAMALGLALGGTAGRAEEKPPASPARAAAAAPPAPAAAVAPPIEQTPPPAVDDEAADDAGAETSDVTVEGDRVTASFAGVPRDAIVREIADAAGAEVLGGVQDTEPTSVELDDVPIDRALERALGGQSFTIVYGGDGRVRRIRLHGGPQEPPPAGSTLTRGVPTSAGGLAPNQIFDVEVRIPTVGPLAEHLGTETATLGQLYRIAVDQNEAALRIAAVDAGMAAIESDANLQSSIDAVLQGTDDAALAAMVRGSAGKRANELVSRILSRTRRPQVRQRAVTVLRQLRQINQ